MSESVQELVLTSEDEVVVYSSLKEGDPMTRPHTQSPWICRVPKNLKEGK